MSKAVALYGWVGEPVGESQLGQYYDGLIRETSSEKTEFRVGDVALFEAEGGSLPYIGIIERLFENEDGEPMLTTRWFFRRKDCPKGVVFPASVGPDELFYSNMVRKAPVESFSFGLRLGIVRHDNITILLNAPLFLILYTVWNHPAGH